MSQEHPDRRVEHVKERLSQELVHADGRPPDPDTVAHVVESAAEAYGGDAPVQEFSPLLIEHDARDALREMGFRREFDDDEANTAPRPGQTATSGQDHEPMRRATHADVASVGRGTDDGRIDDVDSEDVDSDL